MQDQCFQNLIEAMSGNVAIVDETGCIKQVNKKWVDFTEQNFGHHERTNVGANYIATVDKAAEEGDEYAQKVKSGIQDILSKKIKRFELEYPCHSEHEHRWFIADICEIGSFSPRLFLFSHKDVTSLVERENKVLEAQRLEAIGQLSGGIAHDFNNLLGIIMGNIEAAQLEIENNNQVNNYLDKSLVAIERGASLIQKLLSFSRQQNLQIENIELNTFINNTLDLIHPVLGEDIKIIKQLEDPPLTIEVDGSMLSSAILNIAINARQAMPSGGTLTVSVTSEELNNKLFWSSDDIVSGRYVLIAISDSGVGIENVHLSKVFEPFFTTKDVGQGSGLGLSMVFGFMKQSNGYVDITSESGKGTTVSLYLPLKRESTVENNIQSKSGLDILQNKTILLVEDNEEFSNTISNILRILGCEVIKCKDGNSALTNLQSHAHKIDIVLADIIMPNDINGIELAKMINRTYPEIKVLLMSGYSQKKFNGTETLHFQPILEKPFTIKELVEAIGKC